jgi:rhodanese-related sulfurtransferase
MTFKRSFATLSALMLLVMLILSCNSSATSDTQENAPAEDSQRMLDKETFAAAIKKSGAVIVDVRSPAEFEQNHIEGAININFFGPEFKYKLLELDRNKKYYLYCKNETTSYRSMKFMEDNDFKQVYMLKGGFKDWVTEKAK